MNPRPEPRDVLGIDFGRSNTVAVLLSPGRPARVLAIDGGNWIPSAIFVEEDTISVGRDADQVPNRPRAVRGQSQAPDR